MHAHTFATEEINFDNKFKFCSLRIQLMNRKRDALEISAINYVQKFMTLNSSPISTVNTGV